MQNCIFVGCVRFFKFLIKINQIKRLKNEHNFSVIEKWPKFSWENMSFFRSRFIPVVVDQILPTAVPAIGVREIVGEMDTVN